MIWLALLLLGLTTYLIVQRSVVRFTQTPWWLLWLVLMLPAFAISIWTLTHSQQEPVPPELLIGSFILSSTLYFVLVQRGRPSTATNATATPSAEVKAQEAKNTTDPKSVLRPMNKTEEAALQNCFPWSVYYLQNIEYRPQAMICRGQLRSTPEVAYQTIRENVQSHFGDRFLVVFQLGAGNKPFFAIVPNSQSQRAKTQAKLTRPILALGLLVATLITTTLAGVEIADASISPEKIAANPALLLSGLPYSLALITILGIHELGHYLTARYYKIRATLPYFIPVPFAIGTFGAFIQLRSPIPNRKTLFDVGLSGPLSGLIPTLPLLIWGLANSEVVPLPAKAASLDFNAFNPGFSILLALLSKLALGSSLAASEAIKLHPVAVAGCLGLVVTALNLMPVGQLDGGHIVHAMLGQRVGAAISQIARLLVLLLALIQPWLLLWAIILFFMPAVDEPALNDVTELDNRRDFGGLLAIVVLLLIVLPAPRFLMELLFGAPVS